MRYKPEEYIAETDEEFESLPGPIIAPTQNPRRGRKSSPLPEYKGLRVKISLVRDPDYNPREAPKIDSAQDVYNLMKPHQDEVVENIWVLILNTGHRVLGIYEVVRGQVDAVNVTPADILRAVLAAGARAFILVHNHPSGAAEPSSSDKMLTSRVKQAAELIGVAMLDHVVIGYGEITSFSEKGWM
jgi:DNA repair protein RadC